ncbi:MAG: helix-turn-helix domain-containing protein [Cyclobacteriaceae bacterium]
MNYQLDGFAVFIFLGIVQAVFLSFFFFSREGRQQEANLYQGIMVLAMAACTLEIFLCYTGYIQNCLWLVDYSESIAFLIGPAFYLMILRIINGNTGRMPYAHLVLAVVWLVLQIPFLMQNEDVKFNAWLAAYHPTGLELREVKESFFAPGHHSEISLIQFLIYLILGLIAILKAFRTRKESFWRPVHPLLRQLRSGVIQSAFIVLFIFIVKLFYPDDTGDHVFAAYISFAIYLVSFQVVRQSGFFQRPRLADHPRYKNALVSASEREQLLTALRDYMQREKPFLQPGFSLADLATRLKISTHQLSQVINEGLGKNFFEMTAEYRVQEAQARLRDQPHLKVEEIAEQVGYLSKSSFNTAFKKITGQTPSEWRST